MILVQLIEPPVSLDSVSSPLLGKPRSVYIRETKAHDHHSGQGKPEPMILKSGDIAWTSWGKEGLSGVPGGHV